MRCYLKTVIQSLTVLLILSSLYSFIRRPLWTEQMDIDWTRNYSFSQNSHKNDRCLTASVRVLAGEIPQQKKFLAVGLSSVKRTKESYLLQTLHSIFSQSSEELADIVVVVLLADFDLYWVKQTLQSILDNFRKRVLQNQLLVIHADQGLYPPLTGLKRNFNDASDRVTFRSKQNIDYAFLVDFSAGLSKYYIMLEDDVTCSKGFISSIRDHIRSMGTLTWVTLEFSKLGYIGKLYHAEDLPRLAQFLLLFYEEMPCDFLFTHFRTLLTQNKVIRFLPSLFQHMGTYSSFRGTYNHLKDDDFQEYLADNPAADVYTNIAVHENHKPEEAYNQGARYFWGKTPIDTGGYFLVVFREPVVLTRIRIQTGMNDKDILNSAVVELGQILKRTGSGITCTGRHILGSLHKGQFDLHNVQDKVNNSVLCLRITVTAAQSSWVIINNIQVWTKH